MKFPGIGPQDNTTCTDTRQTLHQSHHSRQDKQVLVENHYKNDLLRNEKYAEAIVR